MKSIIIIVVVAAAASAIDIVLYTGRVRLIWKIEKTVDTTMTIGYHGMDVIVCFSFLFVVLFLLFGDSIVVDYWNVYFLGGDVNLV
jgi:hypothetical protein